MGAVRRGFVKTSGRWVHYRVAGNGPPILMLHASPRSSRSLIPLMDHLSANFTCIAPDTPGFGASDALSRRDEPVKAFAQALIEFADHLGMKNFAIYGTHTGAAIAIAVANLAAHRVSGLLLDGCPVFTPDEQQSMLEHYLPPLESRRDGSHLLSIWSRVRDQAMYFPFYRREEQSRIAIPVNDVAAINRNALGFLEAGDHYRDGYRAAILFDPLSELARVSCPVRIHAIEGDLIADHLGRVPRIENVEVTAKTLSCAEWLRNSTAFLSDNAPNETDLTIKAYDGERVFLNSGYGEIYLVKGQGTGVKFREDIPGTHCLSYFDAPDKREDEAAWFTYPPGLGASSMGEMANSQDVLDWLGQKLGCEPEKSPHEATAQLMRNPPKVGPQLDGTHLMRAWYLARDSVSEPLAPELEAHAIHQGMLSLLNSDLLQSP